jgi:hypothetical protein
LCQTDKFCSALVWRDPMDRERGGPCSDPEILSLDSMVDHSFQMKSIKDDLYTSWCDQIFSADIWPYSGDVVGELSTNVQAQTLCAC